MNKVFVVGSYLPSGAAQMNYVLCELLAERFGCGVVVVMTNGEDEFGSPFSRRSFPRISYAELPSATRSEDVLIASPAWVSGSWWGLRLNCRKIMYVQAVDTVPIIDGFFDDYVCVSSYCRRILQERYGLASVVIHPFVESPAYAPLPWIERPARVVLVNSKRDAELCRLLLARINRRVRLVCPDVSFIEINGFGLKHKDLLSHLENARYLLTLSPSEGFGLIPLEAMSRSVAVVGFHGFGGQEYMQFGWNSECWPYPNADAVAESLIGLLLDDAKASALGIAGVETAKRFSRDVFIKQLVEHLRNCP